MDARGWLTVVPACQQFNVRSVTGGTDSRDTGSCLFIDEIDKFSTEFRANTLAEIVDAVYVAPGQIVATSNKSPADLEAKWGSDEAGTILRRIGSEVNAHMVEFA